MTTIGLNVAGTQPYKFKNYVARLKDMREVTEGKSLD